MIEFILRRFAERKDDQAVIWRDKSFSYEWLLNRISEWRSIIEGNNVPPGSIVAIEADFSPNGIALFLALVERRCILVPLTISSDVKKREFLEIAEVEFIFQLDADDKISYLKRNTRTTHPLYLKLRQSNHPGLVLFSSGSTGKSKAAVHDFSKLLEKYKTIRRPLRAVTFLLYDHIGGVNTMLYTLSNGGCIITISARTPDGVLASVEKHEVELLPTSPTFINLILLSDAYQRYNLSKLKIVTYGTEPMPESTLKRFHELFPHIVLQQTYGLSEVGILRSKSKSSDSLWVKVGGEGFETRIVNGILHIKANSAMEGYLNAPSPFTEDGWFNTGDLVEVAGEYIHILGRVSEIINVGGEKVYPVEVESVIQEIDNVAEVTVYGEKNIITGNIVCARVELIKNEPKKDFVIRLKIHCRNRLQSYKVPVKVILVDSVQHSERFKKIRMGNV